ncbi:MAG: flagellar motor switch protein FliG [Desulfobacterales bacterium]|nr:MAG: flagellar motor switch protein FliG [Desulfobacterales bacterium]
MDPTNLSGALKAAILIHTLGKEAAASLLRNLTEDEKKVVNRHLAQIGTISPDVVEKVAMEFTTMAQRAKVAPKKLPPGRDGQGLAEKERNPSPRASEGLEAIRALSADEILELIKDEHPQTIAVILIHLKTSVASKILSMLADGIKSDVALRIANLDKVMAGMVAEVNEVFKEILKNKKGSVSNIVGGVDRLAEILNQTDEISNELILNEIEDINAELAALIKQTMFVFEDLVLVDDRGFQKLLRKVETAELAIALKAASEEVKDKVFRNMSARAGEMLKEEMEDLGPVRMKEVADAQQNITSIIQEMESKGEIIISGRRGEEIIS